jgi:hypothetical protein
MSKTKSSKGLKNYIKLEKFTPKINKTSILLSIIIICIIILQLRTPFITNTVSTLKNNVKAYFKKQEDINDAKNDILDIEEDSLIITNNANGGIDDVNATIKEVQDKNNGKMEERPKFMVQESVLGTNTLHEQFTNNETSKVSLKLFYEPGCQYSEKFMPIWTQIKEVLPETIDTEEINCKRKDSLGFSLCHTYKINSVPNLVLIRPDILEKDELINITYRGSKDFLSIKQWLNSQGIELTYNPEVEHFDRNGGYVSVSEEFNGLSSGISGGNFGGTVLSAEGNLRAPYDKMYRDASRMNEHGEFDDIDDNGCPIANFSKCKENSVNPGYQIFTHRGQWGCIYPDKNTSLNTGFDAAFATVDHYLQSLPPKVEKKTDDNGNIYLEEVPYSADEKLAKMKKCANVYKKEIRNFGLCNNKKLNAKYTAKDRILAGDAKVPFDGMTADDYKDTAETAEAIYNACSV